MRKFYDSSKIHQGGCKILYFTWGPHPKAVYQGDCISLYLPWIYPKKDIGWGQEGYKNIYPSWMGEMGAYILLVISITHR